MVPAEAAEMAERRHDGGGTKVDQAEHVQRADGAERERAEPVEPERRPTYRTHEQQSSACAYA
jgi:hypothetical protein